MNIIIKFLLIGFCFILVGCSSKDKKEVSIIEDKEIELQMIDANNLSKNKRFWEVWGKSVLKDQRKCVPLP